MTCIVGLIEENKVYMGVDSIGVSGSHKTIRKDSKIFFNNDFLIGYSSSFRMGQLLRYNFTCKYNPKDKDIYHYLTTDFVDSIRKTFMDKGFSEKNNNIERGGCFLIAYKNKLFTIESDYQVGENEDNFASIGSGSDYALASLYTTRQSIIKPIYRIKLALECAEYFCTTVQGPFTILNT